MSLPEDLPANLSDVALLFKFEGCDTFLSITLTPEMLSLRGDGAVVSAEILDETTQF